MGGIRAFSCLPIAGVLEVFLGGALGVLGGGLGHSWGTAWGSSVSFLRGSCRYLVGWSRTGCLKWSMQTDLFIMPPRSSLSPSPRLPHDSTLIFKGCLCWDGAFSRCDLCQKKIHYIFRNPGFPSAATDLSTCNYNVQKSDSGM